MTVKLLDVYGSEELIIRASRVSTEVRKKDLKVSKNIDNLIKRKHWKVFEFAHVLVEVEAPIYVIRQWRTHSGAFIEKSRRYTKDEPTFESDFIFYEKATVEYNTLLKLGKKPEQARKVLPMATNTRILWDVNLRDLFSFFRQRLDRHAQLEIRTLALELFAQVANFFPYSCASFLNRDFGSITLSFKELITLEKDPKFKEKLHEKGQKASEIVNYCVEAALGYNRKHKGSSESSRNKSEDSPETYAPSWYTPEAGPEDLPTSEKSGEVQHFFTDD